MPPRLSVAQLLERLTAAPIERGLLAIDGLPCAGKTTLAERIQAAPGFEILYLDDFVRPENEWSSLRVPAFPFEFMRYGEFVGSVRTLARTGRCTYARFDFETRAIAKELRTIALERPVIIEGVSALNEALCDLYAFKIFVDSDRGSVLDAAARRSDEPWSAHWRTLFVPSVDIYMRSRPELRADVIVPGRGAG